MLEPKWKLLWEDWDKEHVFPYYVNEVGDKVYLDLKQMEKQANRK